MAATEIPVTILTDHANLTFWKNPKKVNGRVARWFATLQEYNLLIKHVPGKFHAVADMLSRPPNANHGEEDNQDLTLLPKKMFIRLADLPGRDWFELDDWIQYQQYVFQRQIAPWVYQYGLHRVFSREANPNDMGTWYRNDRVVIPPSKDLRRELVQRAHDAPEMGHPGRDWTINEMAKSYWWPAMNQWIADYVKGCAVCQQDKTLTHRSRVPLYKIPVPSKALPFQVIAMDLITALPKSEGHDAILTIVDHGCTRAALFLPCSTTITGEGVARLYFENVYRWFGLPDKIISDRDPCFTSNFAKALTQKLGIQQNVSSAFHPQTDGLSERKNQWVELYLRHLTSEQQDDWAQWLPIATAAHNNFPNSTTKVAPIEALLGYFPRRSFQPTPASKNQRAEDRIEIATRRRRQAKEALNRAVKQTPVDQFKVGDRVWLEAKNLNLPYQTPKLAPKCHGPFVINKRISPVAYQLQLPPTWTVHDVFHAGLLTPYRETKEHGANFTKPPPEIVDGEEEYEVEAILDHRHHG